MKLKIATILILTLSVFSCKKEIDNKSEKVSNEVKDDLFRVGFNLVVQKDDNNATVTIFEDSFAKMKTLSNS